MPQKLIVPTSKSTSTVASQKLNLPENVIEHKRQSQAFKEPAVVRKSNTSSGIRVEMENTLLELCDMWFHEIKPALVQDNVKIRCNARNGHTKMSPASYQPQHNKGILSYPEGCRAKNVYGGAESADPLHQLDNLLVDCVNKINVAVSNTTPPACAAHTLRVQPAASQHQNRTKTHNAKKTKKGKNKLPLAKRRSTSKYFRKTFDRRSTFQRRQQSQVRRLERKRPPIEPQLKKQYTTFNRILDKANFHRRQNQLLKRSVKRGHVDVCTVQAYFPNFDQKCHKQNKTCRKKKGRNIE